MEIISQLLNKDSEFIALCDAYKKNHTPILVNGVCDSALPLICHAVSEQAGASTLIIVPEEKIASKLKEQLEFYGRNVLIYPSRDFVFDNIATSSHEFEQERLSVLMKILEGDDSVIITVPNALMQYTVPPEVLKSSVIRLTMKNAVSPEALAASLEAAGYTIADTVEGKGQYSRRGSIVDVFSPAADYPCRLDYFGDELDSMGCFDTVTQRRMDNIREYTCVPVSELVPSPEACRRVVKAVEAMLRSTTITEAVRAELKYDLELASAGIFPRTRDKYISLIYESKSTVLDYIGKSMKILVGSRKVFDRARAFSWQNSQTLEALVKAGRTEFKYADVALFEDAFIRAVTPGMIAADYFMESSGIDFAARFNITAKTVGQAGGNAAVVIDELSDWLEAGRRIVFVTCTESESQNLAQLLDDHEIPNVRLGDDIAEGSVNIAVKEQGTVFGFELPSVNFVLLTSGGESIKSRVSRIGSHARFTKKAEKIASYSDLSVGDYIVHANHGIGVYAGLQQLTFEGAVKDYIKINYAGGDVLYVPCGQLDLVSKYIGADNVKINKMSSAEWSRTKARAKSAAKDIAKDLIKLYAARQAAPGYAFPPDGELQDEFESLFEYDETDGQLTAAAEIKADMQKSTPMDRLLCGDVGFGKTEVALRAVFKCVADGKQAAILVPTTILAMQHYRTMLSRFRQYPFDIQMLSRFRAKKDIDDAIEKIATGKTDIVVGTHKLLQNNILFNDLGLLVVDEEQRFGVKHKEKLKELAKNVDVLTLTATPIPRTLNMALSGIRDMSVLEEAPRDRAPVQSYVLEYDESILDDAIRRELRRGGQVFYLHNIVESIYAKADSICKRFPNAVVAVGHGQMSKEELSAVWQSMVEGEIDILVCTTIIETGVDVPNANTLIIENADRMGLSQLHQIRGRVGRSPRKAYAYFTYRQGALLSEDASKRLEAIRDFTEFGSGFKIAMRDLEIRGAGNLLGAEQSGQMEAIGYDLYVKILEEAVNEEKGLAPAIKKDCLMEIACDAYIPDTYVFSAKTRIDFYRKIALLDSTEDRDDLVDEMLDRFGDLPKPVENLMDISLCRNAASACDIDKISQSGNLICFYPKVCDMDIWKRLVAEPSMRSRIMMSPNGKAHFAYRLKPGEDPVRKVRETVDVYSALFTKSI